MLRDLVRLILSLPKAAIGSVSLRVVSSKMVSRFSVVRKLSLTPLLPGPID